MAQDLSSGSSLWRRLFIAVRLAAAWLMWAEMAIIIGIGKAQVGLPGNTPEWNKAWEDYRRWALNPSHLTQIQKLNAKYTIPAILLMYSGVPVRILSDRLSVLLWWGIVCCVSVVVLFLVSEHRAAQLGETKRHRAWTTIVGATVGFAITYIFTVFFTGILLLARSQLP